MVRRLFRGGGNDGPGEQVAATDTSTIAAHLTTTPDGVHGPRNFTYWRFNPDTFRDTNQPAATPGAATKAQNSAAEVGTPPLQPNSSQPDPKLFEE